jgi:protein tyrosine/serine phosphatase
LPGTCTGCTPNSPNLQVASMAALLDRLYNLHWVTEDVARSAQPYIGFYKTFLRAHGFRAIINLRGENPTRRWWQEESRAAEGLNLRHYNVRLSSRLIPARPPLIELAEAFESAPRPILVKCSGGQDRASFAAAVYLLLAGGVDAREAAEGQFALWPYLHRPRLNQRWMQRFPAFVDESIGSARFDEWLKLNYTPDAFADWLSRNGAPQSFLAVQKV